MAAGSGDSLRAGDRSLPGDSLRSTMHRMQLGGEQWSHRASGRVQKLRRTSASRSGGEVVKHSPTPWRVRSSDKTIVGGDESVVGDFGPCIVGPDHEGEGNAAHIVKCVNAHDELVAALREVVAKVGDYEGMGPLGGTPFWYLVAVRDVARAALAKVAQ